MVIIKRQFHSTKDFRTFGRNVGTFQNVHLDICADERRNGGLRWQKKTVGRNGDAEPKEMRGRSVNDMFRETNLRRQTDEVAFPGVFVDRRVRDSFDATTRENRSKHIHEPND